MQTKKSIFRDKMYALLDEWKSSGQTQRSFCKSNDLSYGVFKYWRKKKEGSTSDKKKDSSSKAPSFIPITIPDSSEITTTIPVTMSIVYPNGVKLECSSDISTDSLKKVITIF